MSYVLIGEASADDGPLFVLWTRDASGVRVLPIGSHDRRDMQVIGRQIMQAWALDGDASMISETIRGAVRDHAGRRWGRMVELADSQREAIACSIARDFELHEHEEPTLPAA